MALLKLTYPVHTLDGRCLLDQGSLLDSKTLADLIASGQDNLYPEFDLSRYGSINNDTITFLKEPPYDRIFESQQLDLVQQSLHRVKLPLPVLEHLDYFQKNDFYTYRHLIIVYALSILLARDLLGERGSQYLMAKTGPSHDFGKICTSLSVLKKETPITQEERSMLEHHAIAGYVLMAYYLKDSECLAAVLAKDHHERKDGSGYPSGNLFQDIHTEIIIVSDVYDALISPRPYRSVSYDNRTALEEITGMAERGEINWDALQALVACNREGRPNFREVAVSLEKRGTAPSQNVYGITEE